MRGERRRAGGRWAGGPRIFAVKFGRRMRNFDGDSKTEIWTSIPNLLEHFRKKFTANRSIFNTKKERKGKGDHTQTHTHEWKQQAEQRAEQSRAQSRAQSSNRTDRAQDRAGPTQPLIAISSHLSSYLIPSLLSLFKQLSKPLDRRWCRRE